MKNSLAISLLTIFAVSCAHHRDVRPGAKGIHRISVKAVDKEQGSRNAISQAQHFCEKRNQTAAFINEENKYTGDMDEQTYKTTKKVGRIAEVVGGSAWALGSKSQTKGLGGIVGLGGTAADIAAGKGYTVKMDFKCL